MNSKVAIICCWQGNYPSYFPLWVSSCKENQNFDWLIFGDKEPSIELPSNVIFYKMDMQDIKARINKELNLEGKGLTSPYKLCDLRPAYGLLFKEELKDYTHWGHCDIDLIWGNFEDFINDDILEKYDKVFDRGHLGIYKNTENANNRLWEKGAIYSFDKVVENANFYAFDEITGIERIYRKNGYEYYDKKPYVDISVRYQSKFLFNDLSKNKERQAFFWQDGKVYRAYIDEDGEIKSDEWLYIHFQKKKPQNFILDTLNTNAFWIGPNGFFEKTEDVTVETIEKYNPNISENQLKKEEKSYIRKKIKEFFKKSFKDKRIHLKQRISRLFF